MKTKIKEIRVTNQKTLEGIYDRFNALKTEHGLNSDGETIAFLLDAYQAKLDITSNPYHEAWAKIDSVVTEQMTKNRESEDWTDKREITSAWIQKASGCNFQAIQEWCKKNAAKVADHHNECDITSGQNRRALAEMKRRAKTGQICD